MFKLLDLFFNLGLYIGGTKWKIAPNMYGYLTGWKYSIVFSDFKLFLLCARKMVMFLLFANKNNYVILPIIVLPTTESAFTISSTRLESGEPFTTMSEKMIDSKKMRIVHDRIVSLKGHLLKKHTDDSSIKKEIISSKSGYVHALRVAKRDKKTSKNVYFNTEYNDAANVKWYRRNKRLLYIWLRKISRFSILQKKINSLVANFFWIHRWQEKIRRKNNVAVISRYGCAKEFFFF